MSKMKIFSIPFNGDLSLARWAIDTRQVKEVYFSSPSLKRLSLRCDPSPHSYDEKIIIELLNVCRKKGVQTNLLVNQISLIREDMEACVRYIKNLPFLSSITLGDPLVIDYFVKNFPRLDIQASIIMNLHSVNIIENALKRGIGTVSLPVSFSRNIKMLKVLNQLKKIYPKFKIKLFATYTCFSDCPFFIPHFNLRFLRDAIPVDHTKLIEGYRHKDYCYMAPSVDKGQLIKRPFIRPEDVKYLQESGCIDYLKIIYRFDDSRILRKKFNAYFKREYSGDLFDILPYPHLSTTFSCDNKKFPANFFKIVSNCNKICFQCNYCDRVADQVLSIKNSY